ncbi:MAG: signal peptidase I [Reyranellaceae bacterium]
MSAGRGWAWLRALWAGLLSLVWPGLGQVYAGARQLGLVLFCAAFAFDLAFLSVTHVFPPTPIAIAAVTATWVLFRLAVASDALRRARRARAGGARPWYLSTWVVGIAMVAASAALQSAQAAWFPAGWRTFSVASESELPTLRQAEYVVTRLEPPGTVPDQGATIVFRDPRNPATHLIKRVVGLPGDRIQLRDRVIYLNGKPIERKPEAASGAQLSGASPLEHFRETLPNGSSYVVLDAPRGAAGQTTQEFLVPPASLFVLGDNRPNSVDSRMEALGFVPIANLTATVGTIYWSSDLARLLTRVH